MANGVNSYQPGPCGPKRRSIGALNSVEQVFGLTQIQDHEDKRIDRVKADERTPLLLK